MKIKLWFEKKNCVGYIWWITFIYQHMECAHVVHMPQTPNF